MPDTADTRNGAGKRRGRPPKTSREQIIDAAVQLLLDEPMQPLSLHRVARALGVTPMALYGHVADKDTLLQAVAARLLDELDPSIPEADWQEQLRTWARATRRHFLKYPGLLALLGWRHHIASAWLGQVALLARILSRSGLAGAELADAVRWVSSTLMGAIFMEIASRHTGAELSPDDLRELPMADAEVLRELLPHLEQKRSATRFDDDVERVIDSLQVRAAQT